MNRRLCAPAICALAIWLSGSWSVRAAPVRDAAAGDLPRVRALLAADPSKVNLRGGFGNTPLMLAAEKGSGEVVNFLLEQGAVADAKADNGFTPLMFAAMGGHAELVKLFLDKGAAIEGKHQLGVTPLMWAAQHGHIDVVRLLLARGAAVDGPNDHGQGALMRAAIKGHADVVAALLERGAAIEARDRLGKTPLLRAAEEGHADVVAVLLEKGAAIDSKDTHGDTPLAAAAQAGRIDTVGFLLERGAATASKKGDSDTPLMIAARHLQMDAVPRIQVAGQSASVPPLAGPISILSGDRDGRALVVAVSGKRPVILSEGKPKKLKPDADFAFERAKEYAPGRVEIRHIRSENTRIQITDIPGGRVVGGGDTGTYISAEIVPAISYRNCYVVIGVPGPFAKPREPGDHAITVIFRDLGRLEAGVTKVVMVDLDSDQVSYFAAPHFLVFANGLEIESNQTEADASFVRRMDLEAHRKRLVAYFGDHRAEDCPLQNCLSLAPVLPPEVAPETLPATVEVCCAISSGGLVETVELPPGVPAPAAREIVRAVSGWLFLPPLRHGIPERTRTNLPIALRQDSTAR